MIDRKTKEKFLQELEKIGNVLHACKKVGIPYTSTVYRWADKSAEFKKKMDDALRIGRANIVDVAEGGLVRKAGEGDIRAATYILSRNSPHYRPTRDKYVFEYKRDRPEETPQVTLEDVIDRMAQDRMDRSGQHAQKEREKMLRELNTALPRTPIGDPIYPWEAAEWMDQIIPWREAVREAIRENKPLPSDCMKPLTQASKPTSPETDPSTEFSEPTAKTEPSRKLRLGDDGSISYGPS